MNSLHIGLNTNIVPPSGGFLMISDDVPDVPKAKVFDPKEHSFNPLHKLDYRKAREIAEIVYTVYPQGEKPIAQRLRDAADSGRVRLVLQDSDPDTAAVAVEDGVAAERV